MGKKGKFLFKGDNNKRPKKKSKKSKADKRGAPFEEPKTAPAGEEDAVAAVAAAAVPATNDSGDRNSKQQQQQQQRQQQRQQQPTLRTGTGTITASGTVVTGHGTKFQKEISVGDAILVGDEMRVVTMRLSDGSLNLSTAFSEQISLREPRGFRYVRKPRNHDQERRTEQQHRLEEANAVERNAFDIYGSGESTVFTYRERTENGSYRVKQGVVSSGSRAASTTRGGLLDLRSKKTSDKYC